MKYNDNKLVIDEHCRVDDAAVVDDSAIMTIDRMRLPNYPSLETSTKMDNHDRVQRPANSNNRDIS